MNRHDPSFCSLFQEQSARRIALPDRRSIRKAPSRQAYGLDKLRSLRMRQLHNPRPEQSTLLFFPCVQSPQDMRTPCPWTERRPSHQHALHSFCRCEMVTEDHPCTKSCAASVDTSETVKQHPHSILRFVSFYQLDALSNKPTKRHSSLRQMHRRQAFESLDHQGRMSTSQCSALRKQSSIRLAVDREFSSFHILRFRKTKCQYQLDSRLREVCGCQDCQVATSC